MSKPIFLIAVFFIGWSCGNNQVDEPGTDNDTTMSVQSSYQWQAALNDSTGRLELKKILTQGVDNSSPQTIIDPVNQMYPEIKLDYIKTSNDTVYLKIDDARYLTQQMGSAGPPVYLASLIYNLTGLPYINFVHLAFEGGDHAQPGTFTRESFKNL